MPFTAPGVLIDVGDGTLIPVLPASSRPDAATNAAPLVTPGPAVTTPPPAPATTPSPAPSAPALLDTDALVPAGVTVPSGYLGQSVTLIPAPASLIPPPAAAASSPPSTPALLDTDALVPAGVTVPTGYLGQNVTLIPAPAGPQPPTIGASQNPNQPAAASPTPPQNLDTDALIPIGVHVPSGFLGLNVTSIPAPLVVQRPTIESAPDDEATDALVPRGSTIPLGYFGQNVASVDTAATGVRESQREELSQAGLTSPGLPTEVRHEEASRGAGDAFLDTGTRRQESWDPSLRLIPFPWSYWLSMAVHPLQGGKVEFIRWAFDANTLALAPNFGDWSVFWKLSVGNAQGRFQTLAEWSSRGGRGWTQYTRGLIYERFAIWDSAKLGPATQVRLEFSVEIAGDAGRQLVLTGNFGKWHGIPYPVSASVNRRVTFPLQVPGG